MNIKKVLGILLAVAVVGTIGGWVYSSNQLPKHVTRINGVATPDPGYVWCSNVADGVTWSPGAAEPDFANVVADKTEGNWIPLPGYNWVPANATSVCAAAWDPGIQNPDNPNCIAGPTEGQWVGAAGYTLTTGTNTVWTPGLEYPGEPHVVAGSTEGDFYPALGYNWTDDTKTQAVWQPGLPITGYPNVVASAAEGDWQPAPGYVWTNEDLRQTGPAPDTSDPSSSQQADSGQDNTGRLVLDVGIAALAGAAAEPQDSDTSANTYIEHPIAQAVQDAAISDFKSTAASN